MSKLSTPLSPLCSPPRALVVGHGAIMFRAVACMEPEPLSETEQACFGLANITLTFLFPAVSFCCISWQTPEPYHGMQPHELAAQGRLCSVLTCASWIPGKHQPSDRQEDNNFSIFSSLWPLSSGKCHQPPALSTRHTSVNDIQRSAVVSLWYFSKVRKVEDLLRLPIRPYLFCNRNRIAA